VAEGREAGRGLRMSQVITEELEEALAMRGADVRAIGHIPHRVCVLSGGNIDPMLMLKVIQRGLSAAGRYMTVKMMLSDRPGELATISRIISENDANVTGVDHTRVGGSLSMGDVSITIDMETKGVEHCRQVISALEDEGFKPIIVY